MGGKPSVTWNSLRQLPQVTSNPPTLFQLALQGSFNQSGLWPSSSSFKWLLIRSSSQTGVHLQAVYSPWLSQSSSGFVVPKLWSSTHIAQDSTAWRKGMNCNLVLMDCPCLACWSLLGCWDLKPIVRALIPIVKTSLCYISAGDVLLCGIWSRWGELIICITVQQWHNVTVSHYDASVQQWVYM